jgi:hypothetical protein
MCTCTLTYLGWDAAHVEACASQGAPALHTCDLHAQLCCLDCRYVASGTAPDHDDVLRMTYRDMWDRACETAGR